jgi:hypothetical protein
MGQSLSQRCGRFDSNPSVLDVAQTPKRDGSRSVKLPKMQQNEHNRALYTMVLRFENTTAQFDLLAFHQVQPS